MIVLEVWKAMVLQAELAGRILPPRAKYPAEGGVIRDFQLTSTEGQPVLLSRYRGRFNMVLVFAGESDTANNLLSSLRLHQPELANNETRALAVVAGPHDRASHLKDSLDLDFAVLSDVDGSVHRSMGTEDHAKHILPAVFITDRFGEVFAAFRAGPEDSLPAIEEVLSWIEFINQQCPECSPREWPD